MLLKRYTIPIVLGACLGMILTGVQISATALNAALGTDRTAAFMLVEKVDESSVDGRIMGKSFTVHIPRAGELSQCARAAAGAAWEISDQSVKTGVYYMEKLYCLGGEACKSVAGFCRTSAGAVMKGLGGLGLSPPAGEKQPGM
ncbi:MAG: hypothetical protein M1130_13585 [Actinobacteria bacterium]|nr:hypothetical protein [Actinomycetota bacterium]